MGGYDHGGRDERSRSYDRGRIVDVAGSVSTSCRCRQPLPGPDQRHGTTGRGLRPKAAEQNRETVSTAEMGLAARLRPMAIRGRAGAKPEIRRRFRQLHFRYHADRGAGVRYKEQNDPLAHRGGARRYDGPGAPQGYREGPPAGGRATHQAVDRLSASMQAADRVILIVLIQI